MEKFYLFWLVGWIATTVACWGWVKEIIVNSAEDLNLKPRIVRIICFATLLLWPLILGAYVIDTTRGGHH